MQYLLITAALSALAFLYSGLEGLVITAVACLGIGWVHLSYTADLNAKYTVMLRNFLSNLEIASAKEIVSDGKVIETMGATNICWWHNTESFANIPVNAHCEILFKAERGGYFFVTLSFRAQDFLSKKGAISPRYTFQETTLAQVKDRLKENPDLYKQEFPESVA